MHCAVIGCGIAGPAAALFLKQLGADVTVFEFIKQALDQEIERFA